MECQVSISRTCDLPYEAIMELLKDDPSRALRGPDGSGTGGGTSTLVHLHTGWSRLDRDESVSGRIGHYESVSNGHGRVNLSWTAEQHKRLLPEINGHLEVDQVSADAAEVRYVGHYQPPLGILGRIEEAAIGRKVVEDAVRQLLDETIAHLHQHHAAGAGTSEP